MFAQEPVAVKVNPNAPQFKFVTEVMDYGTIEQSSSGDRQFKFTNVGKEQLIIQNVNSSCGCLVADWPKEPVMPGKSGVITAHYDTKRVGRFEKTLTVNSNADRPSIILKVKGMVLPPAKTDSTEVASPK